MKRICLLALNGSVVMLLLLSVHVHAVSLSHTWHFHSTCYGAGGCNDSFDPVGNVRTATSDNGLQVRIRAFSFTGSGDTDSSVAGWLRQYLSSNGGLGVSNSSTDNSHTMDNMGWSDYMVFEFSAPVTVTSYYMNYTSGDADSTWYAGNLAPGFDFTGKTLADVNLLGLTMGVNDWSSSNPDPLETISTDVVGNYLILAAALNTSDLNDKFKLRTITAGQNIEQFPEPGTLMLLGSGLIILGFVTRRRANKSTP